jgi:D-arabinose 1-dehydrogenase-like Zn-dependent alcohol dehydrogenase
MRVKAARLVEHGQPLRVEEVDLAEPGPQDVVLDVAYAGVNEAFDRIRQRKVRGKIVLDTRA